jgi:hypothetical protein
MRYFVLPFLAILGALVQGCVVQNHASTIERDKNNPCAVHVILQVGIDGTDSDVIAVREQLEACYDKECFIPCASDNKLGCKVLSHVIVKKWSALSGDDRKNFHHIKMVDDDKLPSNADIGTPNGGAGGGTWRRHAYPRTYCHEALHLLGLPDQYCSRIFDLVTHTIKEEIKCTVPPDPGGGTCCTPDSAWPRCSQPCLNHEHDLMATLSAELTCSNILDVVKKAGFDQCPKECCETPHQASLVPKNLFFLGPSYLRFGDKDIHYSSFGFSGEYTRFVSPKLGATLDIGLYFHNESQMDYNVHFQQFNITGGLTYYPIQPYTEEHALNFSAHALAGISQFSTKYLYSSGGSTSVDKNTVYSFHANIGAALDWSLNAFNIRLLQADYTPTFFSHSIQNNFRLSIGISFNF